MCNSKREKLSLRADKENRTSPVKLVRFNSDGNVNRAGEKALRDKRTRFQAKVLNPSSRPLGCLVDGISFPVEINYTQNT